MDRSNQEKYIIKGISFTPFIALFVFLVLTLSLFFIYLQKFKRTETKEYKNTIIELRKEATKTILLSQVNDIDTKIKNLNISIKKHLKERIDEANAIIDRIIKNNPNKSKKEIKEIIKQVLSAIRFNNSRGYYFVYDKSTNISLIHPIKKFVNKNMSNFKDKRGTVIVNLTNSIIKKNNEGYATIYFAKPNSPNKEFKKIIFVRYIPSLNWVIGTGEYIDDALNELKSNLKQEIIKKRYGKNGYFWIQNKEYVIAHPFKPEYINKNIDELYDHKGNKIFKKFAKEAITHKNGTFVTYYWENPINHKIEEKISFVYYIPQLDWIIGTGLYLNDLQNLINQKVKKTTSNINQFLLSILIIFILISILVSIISYILSKKTKSLFEIYKKDLEHKIDIAIKENLQKDKILQEQSKLAAMGEMIGAIAHQWRQPLNSLALNIQLLVEDYLDKKVDEKYLENFEEKQMEIIKFMSKTIDDFRNFFKIKKEKETFSAKKTIKEVLNLVNAQLKNNNITIEVKGDDFEINGYKNEFQQVILNLINNAKDAILEKNINDGKITIIIENNKIIIEDNGIEISEKIANRIFEPYFTTKDTNGTGIGLYMSKNIIEKMDGKLYLNISNNKKQFIIEGLK